MSVSTPSSILAGIPPAYPCDAVASIRAIFALCESVLRPCGDLRCVVWDDFWSAFGSAPGIELNELVRAGDAEVADSLSLFCDEVRGVTRPFYLYQDQ